MIDFYGGAISFISLNDFSIISLINSSFINISSSYSKINKFNENYHKLNY